MKRILLSLIFSLMMLPAFAASQFSSAQTTDIQTIVHDYLIAHPEILVQMAQELQDQQNQQTQTQALKAITANSAALFAPNQTAVAGNPNGTVTLIEFFDYQCVHCANFQKQGVIKSLIVANPNLRVVYKEFPIFGDNSIYAAKAAMAANKQGKYLAMHDGIFATGKIEGALKPADVDVVAKQIGLNMAQYKQDIASKAVQASIDDSYHLAQQLGLQGTPAFIIAPTPKTGDAKGQTTFIPGLVPENDLQQAIGAAQ
jgi:protein-disulfide isomerase